MPISHHSTLGSLGPVLVSITIVLTALVYFRGWLSLRADSLSHIPTWRACGFATGLFLIWVAVASPPSALDHELLTAHMLKHLLLMTVAPPLIWLGEPLRAWLEGSPRLLRGRATAFPRPGTRTGLAVPEVCWLAAAAALIGWHIPPVFTLAMHSAGWHFVEQVSFLVTGLMFWWPVVQPWPNAPKSDLSMILYLFLATLPCDVLSGLLVFCDRVVYSDYLSSSHLFGFTALGDQQCAAALMWTSVTVVYFVAGAILAMRLLSPQRSLDPKLMPAILHAKAASANVQPGLEVF